jgi:hypothetical protein
VRDLEVADVIRSALDDRPDVVDVNVADAFDGLVA